MSEVKVQSKSTAGLSFDGVVSAECCRSEHCFHMTNANGQKVLRLLRGGLQFHKWL